MKSEGKYEKRIQFVSVTNRGAGKKFQGQILKRKIDFMIKNRKEISHCPRLVVIHTGK